MHDEHAPLSDAAGFSLVEALVASAILAIGITSLAQLLVLSARASASAKTTTYASLLAQQKMEQLRGLTFGFDSLGLPLTDTTSDVTVVPERVDGGTGLSPSPPGALRTNTSGYCDFVDGAGRWLAGGARPPPGTTFVRRWSIEPSPTGPNDALVLQVLVAPHRGGGGAVPAGSRLADEARIISVKTRKAG
jgi:type II secretory pathway pseudopilin PulG